jgi:hypothetical protein
MDLGDLPPWAFRYIVEVLRILLPWLRQNLKQLEGSYGKNIYRRITDSVVVSDAIAEPKKKLSAAEELFWWYWLIRLS